MKIILKIAIIFFLGFSSFSQSKIDSENLTENWSSLYSQDGLEISCRKTKCKLDGVEKEFTYGFLQVKNTSSEDKQIQFSIVLDYTDGCTGCDNPNEDVRTILVKANSSITTDCTFNNSTLSFLINNPYQLDHKVLNTLRLVGFKAL